jgi:hypothetical protein
MAAKSKRMLVLLSLCSRALGALSEPRPKTGEAKALLTQALAAEPLGRCKLPECDKPIPPERYFNGLGRRYGAQFCSSTHHERYAKRLERERERAGTPPARRKRA